MAYLGELGEDEQLYLENQGNSTQITIRRMAAGQQQNHSMTLDTGPWIEPPTLFCTASGVILKIETAQGSTFMQLRGYQMQVLQTPPPLYASDSAPLEKV